MNNRNESEELQLKKARSNENKNYINIKNYKNSIIISLIITHFIIIVIFFLIFIKIINDFNLKLIEKDNEIEKINNKLKNIKQEKPEFQKIEVQEQNLKDEKLTSLEKEYLYDKSFYSINNMYSKESLNKLGYSLIFLTHTIEKGLSHFELRPFGKGKIKSIIQIINSELKYQNFSNHFSFLNGINSLREYKKAYETNNWKDKPEYTEVSEFLKSFEKTPEIKTGAFILTKEELKKDYNIDYKKFIKSRHSTRNYKNQELKIEDIKEAIEIAKYSPSACNRQYIKVHYYPTGKMRQNVIDYSLGKEGLYLSGVNTFIITFDVNGLGGDGERNQGYFNAGLFATNLVNAFHSLGIGTCFIQFANSVKDEEKLKQLNEIPSYERIAVILYAGYYDDKSIFAVSLRKKFEDYFKEHK